MFYFFYLSLYGNKPKKVKCHSPTLFPDVTNMRRKTTEQQNQKESALKGRIVSGNQEELIFGHRQGPPLRLSPIPPGC